MASAPPSIDLDQEVLCPICKDFLTDPVTLDCGHNFCQGCITKHCEVRDEISMGDPVCPVCKVKIRKRSFCRNWQLANVAERIKLQEKELCEKHKQRLHLFCKEDEELVCWVCQQSPEHKGHTVVLKEEAAQEYKTLICDHLEHLRKEREKILAYKANMGNESDNLLKLTKSERQKTVVRFRQLHQFLEEQEKHLLNELEEMEKEITRRRDEHLARLSKEHSFLERSIRNMEEKSQQPDSELLQDVKSTLQRCQQRETFKDPLAFPPELKSRILTFRTENPILFVEMKDMLADLKDSKDLPSFGQPRKANVTLNPDSAHPRLMLSQDLKSVRLGGKVQDLPYNPERFYHWPCVLGCEVFKGGRCFWEVTVGSEGEWAVGVAKKSVERKSWFPLSPEGGVWAVGKMRGRYWAFTSPHSSLLSLSEEPRRIWVTLDCEGRCVSFCDPDSGAELCTLSGAWFFRMTLLPFFYLMGEKTFLRIS